MTSPISPLGLLAPAEPAQGAAPTVDDPAAFFAALVAALQILQPPPGPEPAPVVAPPPEGGEDEAGEGTETGPEEPPGPAAETVQPVSGEAIVLGEAIEVDQVTARPVVFAPATRGKAPPDIDQGDPRPPRLDVSSSEPATPHQLRERPAAPVTNEVTPTVIPGFVGETEPTLPSVPERQASPARAEAVPLPPRSEPPSVKTVVSRVERLEPPAMPVERPASEATSAEAPSAAGRVAPAPTAAPPAEIPLAPNEVARPRARRLAERENRTQGVAADAPPRQLDVAAAPPMQLPQVVIPMMPRVEPLPLPAAPEGTSPPAPMRPADPAPAAPLPGELLDHWSQAGNARLASQLAEIMDGLNVTDFKVTLGRKVAAPPSVTAAGHSPDPAPAVAESPRPAPPPEARLTAAPMSPALFPRPAAASPERAEARAPAPQPGATPTGPLVSTPPRPAPRVVASEPGTGSVELPVELPIALPRRAQERPVAPTLPVARQELPPVGLGRRHEAAPEPARPRERPEVPSAPAASASGSNTGPVEGSGSGSEGSGTGGTREARNLPQPESDTERPAGSADRITLQVRDGDGRPTRIRVSVVGDQVRAVITPPDGESARQLERRMDELQSALARQGFAALKVSVQAAVEHGSEGMAGAGLATATSDTRPTPGREQPAGDQPQGRNPRDQQSPGGGQQRQSHGRSRDQGAEQRRR